MIKLTNILSEIKVVNPNLPKEFPIKADKNNINKILKYLDSLGYKWKSNSSLIDSSSTFYIKDIINNSGFIYLNYEPGYGIIYSKDKDFELENGKHPIKKLNEIKVNQPINVNANLINKMMDYANNEEFDFETYFSMKKEIESKLDIKIKNYLNGNLDEFDFSSLDKALLIKIFNIIKPYFEEKNINIRNI